MLKEFAQDLKYVREHKEISLKSIAQQTRLNLSVLESIENGDFGFQPQTYIRAFIKQYASCLDLDVEEVLFDYDLARKDKYRQKYSTGSSQTSESVDGIAKEVIQETETEAEKTEPAIAPVDKVNVNVNVNVHRDKENEKEDENEAVEELPGVNHKVRIVRDQPVRKTPIQIEAEKSSANILSSPVFRNIALTLLGILILAGIYLLLSALFFDGKKDNTEIIRQDFDQVVKEQEQRILKKKSPEEIKDSIKRANDSLKAAAKDSLTFTIRALSYGEIYVVTDSTNYSNPKKVVYNEGETKTFRAKSIFHITSGNTKTFEATLNGTPVEFDTKAVRKVKLNAGGIVR